MPAVSKPAFTETNLIDGWPNCHPRNGTKPRYWVLHTTEGAGGMDLVNFMRGAQVSYHYVVGNDGQVFDLVDTDDASWSVLDANNYCINGVFGPSFAGWTRQQWLDNMGNGIKVMAFLCAQDLIKYSIPCVVSLGRPYKPINSGVIDHRYVTQVLGIGTHGDVGDGFPVDVFTNHLTAFYDALTKGPSVPTPPKPPTPPPFTYPSQAEMITQIWEQMFGPKAKGWPQLGGKSLIDAVADIENRLK